MRMEAPDVSGVAAGGATNFHDSVLLFVAGEYAHVGSANECIEASDAPRLAAAKFGLAAKTVAS